MVSSSEPVTGLGWALLRWAVPALTLAGLGACRPPPSPLDEVRAAVEQMAGQSEAMAARAAEFDQAEVLQRLGTSPHNGPCIRLDDLLANATYRARGEGPTAEVAPLFKLEFDDADDPGLTTAATEHDLSPLDWGVADGKLVVRFLGNAVFDSGPTLAIPRRDVGDLVLRLRMTKGNYVRVALEMDEGPDPVVIDVDVVPDDEFRSYRVALYEVLRGVPGSVVQRLTLDPWQVVGDVVEVDYLQLLPATERFARQLYGTIHEARGGEIRRTVYMHAPGSLRFGLPGLPAGPLELSVGVSALRATAPVVLSATLEVAGECHPLVRAKVADDSRWHDLRADLPVAAGPVTLVLEADGPESDVVFWSNPVIRGPRRQPLNVVMVLEDALRADRLSAYGHRRPTSPFKERFFAGGAIFRNCIAQAPITRPSCPSIMTSLYPSATGVWNFMQRLAPDFLTLAEILRSQGWVTGAVVQNHNAGPEVGLHQGFSFLWMDTERPTAATGQRLTAPWIERHRDDNFFLYLHLFDPHAPYETPPRQRGWFEEAAGQPVEWDKVYDPMWVARPTDAGRRALYDGEIRANDEQLERLVAQLERLGLLKDTAFVFLDDHGEYLGERGSWGHHAPAFVQVLHVPLSIVYPRRVPAGCDHDGLVRNLDIMPTVLDLVGIDSGELLLQGVSLLPLCDGSATAAASNRAAYAEERLSRSGRLNRHAFASVFTEQIHLLSTPELPLQVFRRAEDPGENAGISLGDEEGAPLLEAMHALQSANMAIREALAGERSDEVRVNPEVAAALRALGYLDTHEPSP
jgi:arylsulfatase A-like enzyme